MSHTILVIDDERDIRISLTGILEDEGYQVITASSGAEGIDSARHDLPDLILLDIWMPGMDGLETLQALKNQFPGVTVIMISGHGTIETAVRATKLGAFDFIEKPLSLEKVLISVSNALQLQDLKAENAELRRTTGNEYELVGCTPVMEELKEQVLRVAPTSTPVLICGENGSGKELVARSVHYHSPRRERSFIAINCASIPEELIESELFGHEKGGGGGTLSQRKGRLDLADGGTLFLDEIGDMSLSTQARLLRVIQERSFERIGGSRQISVDVRIIAATSRMLELEIEKGQFREDLYYRLNVVPFRVPPLREHLDDIPDLVRHIAAQFYRREGREAKVFNQEALELLGGYEWPGNVRELKNIVERILIMTPGRTISRADIPGLRSGSLLAAPRCPTLETAFTMGSLRDAREEFEREFIIHKLEENDWNISRTSEIIELERSNLHRKIKSYGIEVRK